MLPAASVLQPIDRDPEAERMERLMRQLQARYPRQARVLTLEYVEDQGQAAIARELGCSRALVNALKREGKIWLDAAWRFAWGGSGVV